MGHGGGGIPLVVGDQAQPEQRLGHAGLVAHRPPQGQALLVAGPRRRQVALVEGHPPEVVERPRHRPPVARRALERHVRLVQRARGRKVAGLVGEAREPLPDARDRALVAQAAPQPQALLVVGAGRRASPRRARNWPSMRSARAVVGSVPRLARQGQGLLLQRLRRGGVALVVGEDAGGEQRPGARAAPRAGAAGSARKAASHARPSVTWLRPPQ